MNEAELRAAVTRLLDTHSVLTLATVYEGRAHATSLMYVPDGYSLYWLSAPDSRHSRALEANPAASVTIARQYTDFREICGLQLYGSARRLTDKDALEHGLHCLGTRYPFLQHFRSGAVHLMRHFGGAALYCFEADEITLIDNGRGFAFKRTLRVRPPVTEPADPAAQPPQIP